MDESKLSRIIRSIREEMTTDPGGTGEAGFSSKGDKKTVAGYDKLMGPMRKRYAYGGPNSRRRWKKDESK